MNQSDILFPMVALVAWTFVVLLQIPYRRFGAVFAKDLDPDDFKLGESERVSASVSIPNRNYMNLLELPILFYVACLTAYLSDNQSSVVVVLAWVYVGLRVLHSLVHLSYNNVIHRLAVFAASNIVLAVIWLQLGIGLIGRSES